MWTVSTTKGVSLFSSVWELGTPLFYQCPILGVQFTPNPALTPGPSPMGRGGHASQKTKKTKDLQGKDGFGGDGPESGDHFDGDRIGEKE